MDYYQEDRTNDDHDNGYQHDDLDNPGSGVPDLLFPLGQEGSSVSRSISHGATSILH